ncbi:MULTISPECIES: phospholipase A [Rhodanobacter]|jgi:phospholipase A1|uniref:Phospholipase A1 n=1 Tax=Rhodanobacter glycinis TaxID=582702 RepID=A0A1I3XMR8_9GAMM|nr:phospholipase A [Rhodanobacter glycinis]SFK20805.1 phospholipase A1 [Rhodanobacter glycinis]
MKQSTAVLAATIAGLLSMAAHAQNPNPMDIRACTAIESDAQRLACYDKATGRENLPAAEKRNAENTEAPPSMASHGIFSHEHRIEPAPTKVATPLSLLDTRWELSPESKLGTFNIRGYQPVYVMPVFATSNQNDRPTSPNPVNTVQTPQDLDNVEAKFQISLKTKVWQGVFGDAGDLWIGYTQSSRWQAYNSKLSRPFRETNYEPEAMLVFNTHYHVLGWDGRLLGIGVDHQSNGRSDPLSRSWNRVIADFGFERAGWTLMIRPWWRIPESRQDDNNPDISDYIGRADMQLIHEWHGQEFGLMLRHSLRGGSRSHGAARFTWSFPVAGNVRGYMELFKGYGESLIDYNHNATYLGVGISLLDWY